MPADSINFIDEHNARRILLGLFKHVTDTACTDAHDHFDKVRTGNREKRHIGFTRDGPRQQRLTRTRRANQQSTTWNFSAEPLELVRIFQEVDNLNDVVLGFINASNIIEGYAALLLREKLGSTLAKAHGLARARLHLPHQEDRHADNQNCWQPVNHQGTNQAVARRVAELHINALGAQQFQIFVSDDAECRDGLVVASLADDITSHTAAQRIGHTLDRAVIHLVDEVRIAHFRS